MNNDAVVVYCTCPNEEVAGHIATTLVAEGLAACVNTLAGIASTYVWEGKVNRDEEVLLMIKSSARRLADIEARISYLHPYELPEIIAVPVSGGSSAYLDWICKSTESRNV